MTPTTFSYLASLAVFIGVVHTLMGPDHYIPFVAMARAGRWSLARTLVVTALCGVGHVIGSVLLGLTGIALGWAVGGLAWVESVRGDVAAWLLLIFGGAYTVWGLHRARRRGHAHRHLPGHQHGADDDDPTARRPSTTWALFVVFVFGPCEPLIPQLMYPAVQRAWWTLAVVVVLFALATIATMTLAVTAGYIGLQRWRFPPLERYSEATAGLAVTACGLAVKLGL